MVAKSAEEIAEMRAQMASGELPPNAYQLYLEEEARTVYGHDAVKTRNGYIEQGIGSAKNQTRNSIEAYKKYHSHEPDFEKNLARMTRELAEAHARRAAERGASQ